MRKIKDIWNKIYLLAVILCFLVQPDVVKADTSTITFGSESYTAESNGEFMVGVYINGQSKVGTYYVELEYDQNRMEYVSGAEVCENGKIVLEGTGTKQNVKYMLTFRTISGGEAYIRVKNALVNMGETDNTQKFEITEMDSAVVMISGTDTVGQSLENKIGFQTDLPHVEDVIVMNRSNYYMLDVTQLMPTEINWNYELAKLNFMGEKVTFLTNEERTIYFAYLFDESEEIECYAYNPTQKKFYPCETYANDTEWYLYVSTSACQTWPEDLTLDIVKKQKIVYAIDKTGNGGFMHLNEEGKFVSWDEKAAQHTLDVQNDTLLGILIITGLTGFGIITIAVIAGQKKNSTKKHRKHIRRRKLKLDPSAKSHSTDQEMEIAMSDLPKEIKKITETQEKSSLDNNSLNLQKELEVLQKNKVEKETADYEKQKANLQKALEDLQKSKTSKEVIDSNEQKSDLEKDIQALQNKKTQKTENDSDTQRANLEKDIKALQKAQLQDEVVKFRKKKDDLKEITDETVQKEPVISVKDVTMRFRVSTSNASGIKEYFIQLLKKQVMFRELLALNHVSFDVYKGEVVGIIGTNGSGKSTVLRIVSGALIPTEGEVLVDKRKVQLLTLGTGFDMELTARENVYLNGAIIGYTEQFINEHYDEIVKFAELEGFMEEKVKNFSSGMVSRLGFAIATVGDAAEILILDEVLSVGDEFFRKKSLKRVKEMIHGGSTVLMVSHSIGTILENCSKVVWIEKGVLKMVGEPKAVCGAYQKYHENK